MTETRRVRMTKKMIKDALLELLETTPLNKITVTNICETADVHRSTFYAYYTDAGQLLHEIENDVLEQITSSQDIAVIESDNAFFEMLIDFFEYVRKNERLFRILVVKSSNSSFNHRLAETVLEKYHSQAPTWNTTLTHYGYIYAINGVIGLLQEWIKEDFPIISRKFAAIVLKMSVQANEISQTIEDIE